MILKDRFKSTHDTSPQITNFLKSHGRNIGFFEVLNEQQNHFHGKFKIYFLMVEL